MLLDGKKAALKRRKPTKIRNMSRAAQIFIEAADVSFHFMQFEAYR